MPKFMICFDDAAMDYLPDSEFDTLSRDAHAVNQAAKDAGIWVYSGGLTKDPIPVVAQGGTATDVPYHEAKVRIGGFMLIDVPTRAEAQAWAAKIAAACRCPQEVHEVMLDPENE